MMVMAVVMFMPVQRAAPDVRRLVSPAAHHDFTVLLRSEFIRTGLLDLKGLGVYIKKKQSIRHEAVALE
uniref:Uncharacterized protein n=1 Tax=Romanomermis culicivorax TaxID=13658 RepID=A0A915HX35_ROMCU